MSIPCYSRVSLIHLTLLWYHFDYPFLTRWSIRMSKVLAFHITSITLLVKIAIHRQEISAVRPNVVTKIGFLFHQNKYLSRCESLKRKAFPNSYKFKSLSQVNFQWHLHEKKCSWIILTDVLIAWASQI